MNKIEWPTSWIICSPVIKEDDNRIALIVTEIIRYIAIVVPVYLSVWRYVYFKGYTEFAASVDCSTVDENDDVTDECRTQFWCIVTAVFIGFTLMVYVPMKLLCSKTLLRSARYLYGWRPSVLSYLLLCALPCFVIIIIAIETSDKGKALVTLDSTTLVVIQVVVMGLTVTEWMAKLREEVMTYDLTVAMAVDFFFAYDVFDFFFMFFETEETFQTGWFYVTFIFAYIAMFKFIPNQPISMDSEKDTSSATRCILISLFCNDIPFVIIRISVMAEYGIEASDLIHPAKNIAYIVFGALQLFMIHQNRRQRTLRSTPKYNERRCQRNSSIIVTQAEDMTPGNNEVIMLDCKAIENVKTDTHVRDEKHTETMCPVDD